MNIGTRGSRILGKMQHEVRVAMTGNIQSGTENRFFLPSIGVNVCEILNGAQLKGFRWIDADAAAIEPEIQKAFSDFCRRYYYFTKTRLTEEQIRKLYESFMMNYESMRILLASFNRTSPNYYGKIAQYWDADTIARFLTQDADIAKKLGLKELDKIIFSNSNRLHFLYNNTPDPYLAFSRVSEHLSAPLSDESLESELGVTKEEAPQFFTFGIKVYFAVGNIKNPLNAVKKVKQILDEVLTDENIAKELDIEVGMAQELFDRTTRLHFAMYNSKNPLDGLRKMKHNFENELTDEKIAAYTGINIDEVRIRFSQTIRIYFATKYIKIRSIDVENGFEERQFFLSESIKVGVKYNRKYKIPHSFE